MKIVIFSYSRKYIWIKKYNLVQEIWKQLLRNYFLFIFLLKKILEKHSRLRKSKNTGRYFVTCLFLDKKIQEICKKI